MSDKKVLIIGAGIAGLSAGSYLSRCGYDVEIHEMHSIPGGLCAGWKRKGYTIDYCIHWLMGTKPGTGFDKIWEELGAFTCSDSSRTEIIDLDEFGRIGLSNSDILSFYSNADKLKEELLRIAPEDRKTIHRFCKSLKKFSKLTYPAASESWKLKNWINYLSGNILNLVSMLSHMNTTMDRFCSRWKSPLLREVFSTIVPGSWSLGALTMGLAMQHSKSAGYPAGGSLEFVQNIERKCISSGCKIVYNSKVVKVITEDNMAKGILPENSEPLYSDYIVCASDGHTALFELLEGKYLTAKLKKAYETFPLFPSTIFIGFGVKKDLKGYSHSISPYFDKPLKLPDGSQHRRISIRVHNFDPSLAPEGKTLVTVLIESNSSAAEWWEKTAVENRKKYDEAKKETAELVLEKLDILLGGIKRLIEVIDVSTPHTVMRYTGNWKGSYEGFAPTPRTIKAGLPKELPGLKNFYMIGQWTSPGGGLPPAAIDGRKLALRLCNLDKLKFRP